VREQWLESDLRIGGGGDARAPTRERCSGRAVIAIGPRGYAAVWLERPESRETTTHALARGFWDELELYDGGGRPWRVEAVELPNGATAWRRLLARTVWNPRTTARISYREPTTYELPTLTGALRRALSADDDALTQFHEAAEIELWLAQASTFEDVVAALERAEQP
jgi:hypothetical protein